MAHILWSPDIYRRVLEVVAFRAGSVPNSRIHRILEHPCLRRSVVTYDGSCHLLLRNSGRTLQLRLRGADISEPVHLFVEAVMAPDNLNTLLNSLESFSRFHAHADASPSSHGRVSNPQRLCLILRVLDGRLAGASYREIAVVLYGRARVDRDWNLPDNHLKNRVRRAAQRGKFLMGGGYRDFLS